MKRPAQDLLEALRFAAQAMARAADNLEGYDTAGVRPIATGAALRGAVALALDAIAAAEGKTCIACGALTNGVTSDGCMALCVTCEEPAKISYGEGS